MTQIEACIVCAHTGAVLPNLDMVEFHKYVEGKLGERLTPEDLQTKKVWLKMQAVSTDDFINIKVTKDKPKKVTLQSLGFNKEKLKNGQV